jgi:hypothetical protein
MGRQRLSRQKVRRDDVSWRPTLSEILPFLLSFAQRARQPSTLPPLLFDLGSKVDAEV